MDRQGSQVMHSSDASTSHSSTSVPTGDSRLKSYPVRVPDSLGNSPPALTDDIASSYRVAKRRTLSISIGDTSSSRYRNESVSSIGAHHHRSPPMVIRSRRSSWSTSSVTLQPSTVRRRGVAPPPKRSLWQLSRNNAIQLGLEFCYATETAMVTPILLQLGLPTNLYGIAFFVAPIFGFLMNPLIGSTSDGCACSWGRRRPFILALGIGTLVGVSLYLNGGDLGALMGSSDSQDALIGIILTLIGVVILDLSADSSDGPSRAYLLDVCNLDDINTGLNLRAILGGIGGGFGYITNGIDWTSTSLARVLGGQLRVVFFFNVIIYTICLILNLTSIPETPLKRKNYVDAEKVVAVNGYLGDANRNDELSDDTSPLITKHGSANHDRRKISESRRAKQDYLSSSSDSSYSTIKNESGRSPLVTSPRVSLRDASRSEAKELPLISENDESCEDEEPTSVLVLLKSILHMPTELRRLCINHYFGWAGMVTVLLFFTDFVGQAVYNGDPTAPEGTPGYNSYHLGVKMGCWGMAVFAFSSSLSAIFFMKVENILSHRTLYVFGQLSFALGTGFMALLVDYVYAILILCFTFGVQFTTLFTIPFNILASFHDCDAYKNPAGGIKRGLGTDVACLCCQLFLAQITVSAMMGPLVSAIGSHITVVVFASIMGFLASISSALLVIYTPITKKEENESIQERC